MKNLILIRHAKASWDNPNPDDFERPITPQGQEDAHAMGTELKKLKIHPDLIVASPAKRTMETAEIIANELGYPVSNIKTDKQIYSGGVEDMVELIKATDKKVNTLIFFGHNPNITWLVHYFCENAKMNMPTCGVIHIEFDMTSWDHVSDAESKLVSFIHPEHEQSDNPLQ
jgi:phosphohistidine phosphatase